MKYEERDNVYIFLLEDNESDFFLVRVATFANKGENCIEDTRSGLRYAYDIAYAWLENNFTEFQITKQYSATYAIVFKKKDDAMHFKLIWSKELAENNYI